MSFPDDQIVELKEFFGEVQFCPEGNVPYFLLPKLCLPAGCSPNQVDALLCPTSHHGYLSRLFFAERVACSKALNWNLQARILERNWHAFSWDIKHPNQRLAQLVAVFLGAFQ